MPETHPPKIVAGVIVYNNDGHILLAKSYKWQSWVVVGGHLEWGESLEECVAREVKEELGIDVTDIKFIDVQESILSPEFHKPKHMVFLDYCAKAVTTDIVLNDELQEYQWVDPQEALSSLPLGTTTHAFITNFINKQQ